MKNLILSIFKSNRENQREHFLKRLIQESKFDSKDTKAKCICEMQNVTGYCHEHKTDWL